MEIKKILFKIYNFNIIISFIFYFFIHKNNYLILLNILIIYIYINLILLSYLKKYILIFIFLNSLFLFQYGRIVLLPLFNIELVLNWFTYIKVREETATFINSILIINLLGIILGMLIKIKKRSRKYLRKNKIKKNIIFIILTVFAFFYFKENILILKILSKYSYLEYYKLGSGYFYQNNIIEKACYNIFLFTLPFALALEETSKKEKIFLIILNLLDSFIITLRGGRSAFLACICFSIWYLYNQKILKINLKKIISIGMIFFILIVGLENYRNKEKIIKEFSILKITKEVIYSQGTTGTFLALLKEKPEIFEKNKVPYIFSSLIGFRSKQQDEKTYDKIVSSKNVVLANRMSTSLNKKLFLSGAGIGGNYLMEMYLFGGMIGIVFLSALQTMCLNFIDKNYNNFSWLIRSFLIMIIPKIFLVPRNNYLIYIPFIDIAKFFFVYFLIIISTQILEGVSHAKYKNNNIS